MLAKLIVAETKPTKVCGVCGDRAKSYHFGGISCDSCKAFFRRSVQNDAHRAFRCSFRGRCDITMANRKCCQYCRFRKCIGIGMETSWVMTEEERVNMLQARLWKRRPTTTTTTITRTDLASTTTTTTTTTTVAAATSSVTNFGGGERLCVKRERPSKSSSPTDDDNGSSTNCGQSSSRDSEVSGDDDCDDPDVSCPAKRALLSSEFATRRLSCEAGSTDTDTLLAADLTQIDAAMAAFHDCFRSKTNLKSATADCSSSKWLLVVLFVVSIQRLVRFARNLEPFSSLYVADQVALLKSNIFEVFLVVHMCDADLTSSSAPASPPAVLKRCPFLAAGVASDNGAAAAVTSDSNSNESVGTMFRSAIQGDTTTLVLLLLVVLFCPDSDELTNPAAVEAHQIRYCSLLDKHMRSRSQAELEPGFGCDSRRVASLPKLLLLLPVLREMRDRHVSFSFDLNDEDVEFATSDIFESIEKGYL